MQKRNDFLVPNRKELQNRCKTITHLIVAFKAVVRDGPRDVGALVPVSDSLPIRAHQPGRTKVLESVP